jgi:hypothetical protein
MPVHFHIPGQFSSAIDRPRTIFATGCRQFSARDRLGDGALANAAMSGRRAEGQHGGHGLRVKVASRRMECERGRIAPVRREHALVRSIGIQALDGRLGPTQYCRSAARSTHLRERFTSSSYNVVGLVNQVQTVWHVRSRDSRKLSGTDGLNKGDNKQLFVSSYIVFPAANPCMRAALLMGKLSAANPMPLRLE